MDSHAPSMPLVHNAGALGDFLLTLPFLRALRSAFPGASWTLVAREEHARLTPRIFPLVRRGSPGVLEFAALSRGSDDPGGIRDLALRYGGLFGFVRDAEHIERTAKAAGVATALTEPLAWTTRQGEEIEVTLEGIMAKLPGIRRHLVPEDFAIDPGELPDPPRPHPLLGWEGHRVALVFLGASNPSRIPPRPLVDDVATRLSGLGWTVIFALGPVEEERGMRPPPGPSADCPDLPSLAQAISRAGLYIGGNTGPTHLASALGVPTLSLLGAPDPLWRPRGIRARALGGGEGYPSAEEVIDAAMCLVR